MLPNPSFHTTCYRWLRQATHAGELQRQASPAMHSLLYRALCALLLPCLVACAAQIQRSGTDSAELIHTGTTEAQLVQRLGPPIRSGNLVPPRPALALWEGDHQVSLLVRQDTAVSESVFGFRGRLGTKASRATQASFDSFMTLGLAEIFLIPKALWELVSDEDLQLTVWFDGQGRALAYKWDALQKQQ